MAVPCRVHAVLMDSTSHRNNPRCPAVDVIKRTMSSGELFHAHTFAYAYTQLDIEHRLTKLRHPWTNASSTTRITNYVGKRRHCRRSRLLLTVKTLNGSASFKTIRKS